MRRAKVYIMQAGAAYKIGVSENPIYRMEQFQPGCPIVLKIVLIIEGGYGLESKLHWEFRDRRLHHEWFALTPEDITDLKLRFRDRSITPSLEPALPYIRPETDRIASAEMAAELGLTQ